jgi:hypothetical protein
LHSHLHGIIGDGWCLPHSHRAHSRRYHAWQSRYPGRRPLANDALLVLTSCLLSYAALRARSFRRMHLIECAADTVFITAMVVMTLICGFVTYAMSISSNVGH